MTQHEQSIMEELHRTVLQREDLELQTEAQYIGLDTGDAASDGSSVREVARKAESLRVVEYNLMRAHRITRREYMKWRKRHRVKCKDVNEAMAKVAQHFNLTEKRPYGV